MNHVIQKIRNTINESPNIEIYLSQMAMNTLLCEYEFLGVTQNFLIIKDLGIELWIEPGVEEKFEYQNETAYFRIQTVQDCYQRTGEETEKILL